MDIFQILSIISLGYNGWKGMLWLKETKVGRYVIGFFLMPYIIYGLYKLTKDEEWARLVDKWEREKITYYF